MSIKFKLILSYLLVSAFIVVLSMSFLFSSSKVNGFINTNLNVILTDKEASGTINNEFKNVVIHLKSAISASTTKEIDSLEQLNSESFSKIDEALDNIKNADDIHSMSDDMKAKADTFLKTKKEYIKVHDDLMIQYDDLDSMFRKQKGYIFVSQNTLNKQAGRYAQELNYLDRLMELPLEIKVYLSEVIGAKEEIDTEEGVYSILSFTKVLKDKTGVFLSGGNYKGENVRRIDNEEVRSKMQLLLKTTTEMEAAAKQFQETQIKVINLENSLFVQIADLEKHVKSTEEILNNMESTAKTQMDSGITEVRNISSRVTSTTFIMLAVILVLAVIVGLFSATKITTPLVNIMTVAECIKHGDLTCGEIKKTSSDEFGHLTDSINNMKKSLYELVHNIKNGTDYLSGTSDQMVTLMAQMNENLNNTTLEMTAVASAAEELSSSTSNIIESVQAGITEVQNAKNKVNEGNSKLQQSIAQVNKVASSLAGVSDNLEELKTASQAITNIISIIVDIAEQTNLLALNAAIEAARAGEAGRGFAVVADEVRKLAEKTSTSTQEISSMVSSIQNNVIGVVDIIHQGIEEVEHSSESINAVGDNFKEVVNQMQTAANTVEPILVIIEQQSEAITNITATVTNVSIASADNKVIVDEVSSFSDKIGDLAHQLKDNTSQFKV
ncbi:MAG: methyl-accepting chemotaxis protein [Deferribacterales bacterium]